MKRSLAPVRRAADDLRQIASGMAVIASLAALGWGMSWMVAAISA